jgi:PAS domain S-box-containing protein
MQELATTDPGVTEQPAAPVDLPPARASVLLVDDQPARLLTYEAILNGLDVHCVRAHSGSEALEKLLRHEFAVVLLDVQMPDIDGFEVARLVREHPRLERMPIIFVTGEHISAMDQLRGYEVGAIDYIAVPVVPEILRSKVVMLVELYQRRNELRRVNAQLSDARQRLEAEHSRVVAGKEKQLRAVFEHPDQVTIVLQAVRDQQGNIYDWIYREANSHAVRSLGLTRETLLGRGMSTVLDPEHFSRVAALCGQVLQSQEGTRYEADLDGRDYLVTIFPIDADLVVSSGMDITERKRIEAGMKEAERRKDEFLAMLAHELRNPVAPILSVAEALARLLAPDDKQQALVRIVQRQANHLSRLLDDLLDVARITQGRIELRREPVALSACIEAAQESVEPVLREKRQDLRMFQASDVPPIHGDRVRLAQCIGNLLSNATKYSNAGSVISLSTRREGEWAVLEVRDEGCGIDPAFLPHVFDLFAQSTRAIDRSLGGLGIGLSVCRKLVELHGGRVEATSEGVGKGSAFTMFLPAANVAQAEAAAAPASLSSAMRVLIIDDNTDAADSMAMLLQIEGHEVATAYSAEDGLAKAASFGPQVVLLDIGLPRIDGCEVARRLRASGLRARLIAVTGYGEEKDRRRAKAAGFHAHLAKPVDYAALGEVLRQS